MKITEEMILQGMSGNGGWNAAQFEALGIDYPPAAGWKQRAIGNEISTDNYQKFIDLKGMTKKVRRRIEILGNKA